MSSPTPRNPSPVVLATFDAATVFAAVAARLTAGVSSPGHPFRLLTLATSDAGFPAARWVVLRGFDADAREVRLYTDARSPKVAHLRADPRATLLWYDPAERVQVRIPATVTIHCHDTEARMHWLAGRAESRLDYASATAPGSALPTDEPVALPPPPPDDSPAFANFAVLLCRFNAVDVLELNPAGHRRARLTWPDGLPTLTRLVP